MTYIKNNWKIGDTITADKLNNIENGIYNFNNNSFFYLDINNNTLNKTWNEINNAVLSNKIMSVNSGNNNYQPARIIIYSENGTYKVYIRTSLDANYYEISNPDGYPTYVQSYEPPIK